MYDAEMHIYWKLALILMNYCPTGWLTSYVLPSDMCPSTPNDKHSSNQGLSWFTDPATEVQPSAAMASLEESTEEPSICCNCNAEFLKPAELADHKKTCVVDNVVLYDQEDSIMEDGEEQENPSSPQQEELTNDASNLEGSDDDMDDPADISMYPEDESLADMPPSPDTSVHSDLNTATAMCDDQASSICEGGERPSEPPTDSQPLDPMGLPDSNVKLESLKNTNVAVAQFAENNNMNPNDLVMLQSTLYHLQQQQLLQLQMLQQLQQHIVMGATPAQLAALPMPALLPPGFNPMLLQSMNKSLLAAMGSQKVGHPPSGEVDEPGKLDDDSSRNDSSGSNTPNPRMGDATHSGDLKSTPSGTPGPQEVNMPANMPLNPNNPMLSSDLAKLELFKKGESTDFIYS